MMNSKLSRLLTLSYPITRPFPHARALGSALTLIALCLSIFFGFVAVATNAYTVQPYYTSNPNATESELQWFQKAPFSWFGSLETTCQDSVLAPAETFMTTNHGFVYTLDRIWTVDHGSTSPERVSQVFYHNSDLRDCNVQSITIIFDRLINEDHEGRFWTWGRSVAKAVVTCTIGDNTHSLTNTHANFTISLPEVDILNDIVESFLTQENNGLKSMWYGILLTSGWYRNMASAMAYTRPQIYVNDDTDIFAHGTAVLRRNVAVTDWRDLDFFFADVNFPTQHGMLPQMHPPATIKSWHVNGTTDPFYLPDISVPVDAFAKSFYSLLATDFGIVDGTNALLSQDSVQHLRDINDTMSNIGFQQCVRDGVPTGFCWVGTVDHFDIDASANLSAVPPARLVTQYLCSVPTQKSQVSITYTVTLAILVFIRAAWSLFSLLARWTLVPADDSANECIGCAAGSERSGLIGLRNHTPTKSASSSLQAIHPTYQYGALDDDEGLYERRQARSMLGA